MMIKSKSPLYAFVGPRWIGEHRAASPSSRSGALAAEMSSLGTVESGCIILRRNAAYRSEMPTNRIFGSTTSRSAFVLWPGAA